MPTVSKGIMEQIRDHLAQGRSSRELIDAGFAPGSVYKAQRQVRRKAPGHRLEPVQLAGAGLPVPAGPAYQEWPSADDLFEEDEPLALYALLNHEFPILSERVEELSEKLNQLDQAHGRIKDLEAANHELQRRLKALDRTSCGFVPGRI